MMNIPPSEAKKLSLYEYDALLWNWNDAHKDSDDVDPPDADLTLAMIDRINRDERLTGPREPASVN